MSLAMWLNIEIWLWMVYSNVEMNFVLTPTTGCMSVHLVQSERGKVWAAVGWYEVLPVSVECQLFSLHHSFNSACKTVRNCHLGWRQSWESCYVLSPSSSTSTYHCGVCDTRSCLCDILVCNECWMGQSVWSMAPGSLTVTWLGWYLPSFTGFRYLCISITNSAWWHFTI